MPGQILRDNEDPSGSVPAVRDGGDQIRGGGAVRDGQVGVPGGPGVLGGVQLSHGVLQAHAPEHAVLGPVPELVGDPGAPGQGANVDQVPVHGRHCPGVSAAQGTPDPAVLQRGRPGGRCRQQNGWRSAEDPKEAQGVRNGSGPDRRGADAGRPELPTGPAEPTESHGRRQGLRVRRPPAVARGCPVRRRGRRSTSHAGIATSAVSTAGDRSSDMRRR